MQTVIQVICSPGVSLRDKIVKDKKLEDYNLIVSKQKTAGRNPGWAKLYSSDNAIPGVINLVWHRASLILVGRIVTRGSNTPDKLLGDFVTYLMAQHPKRVKAINIFPG